MKLKKILILILILIFIFSLSSCNDKVESFDVTYIDSDGTILNTLKGITLDEIDLYKDDNISLKVINDTEYYFYGWDKEITGNTVISKALYYNTLPKTKLSLTNRDVFKRNTISNEEKTDILVVFVSFSDGISLEKESFEDMFIGEYTGFDRLKSVKSYFKENTKKDLLDFTFYYYDSPMSSSEAWHYVNDEDNYGNFKGNEYIHEIFRDIKPNLDTKKFDKDKDGYIDSVIFVFNDILTDDSHIYGAAQSYTTIYDFEADKSSPNLNLFVKIDYDRMMSELEPGISSGIGIRTLIHEVGHLFGLVDYYDFYPYEGETIDTLGCFDMQSYELGDWNPFSKMTCGFLDPYVITSDIDDVTLKLDCTSLSNDAILIPKKSGFNGTPFDEYILIDVFGKFGANGYDWEGALGFIEGDEEVEGGVRFYHVDARLLEMLPGISTTTYIEVNDISKIDSNKNYAYRYGCTNGYEPYLKDDNQFYHLIDLVPKDGTSKYRICTPTSRSVFTCFSTMDLFLKGDTFTMETHNKAFVNEALLNCKDEIEYIVKILDYNEKTGEALINIHKK